MSYWPSIDLTRQRTGRLSSPAEYCGDNVLQEMKGLLVVSDRGAVPPGDVAVWPDEDGAGFVSLTGAVPVVVTVLCARGADDDGAQESRSGILLPWSRPCQTGL